MPAPRRNAAALKGMPAQGSKPANRHGGVLPQGQYSTINGTKNAPGTSAPYVPNPGSTTVNSTPAGGKRKR